MLSFVEPPPGVAASRLSDTARLLAADAAAAIGQPAAAAEVADPAEFPATAAVPEVRALMRALPVILRSFMLALTISDGQKDSELETDPIGLRLSMQSSIELVDEWVS